MSSTSAFTSMQTAERCNPAFARTASIFEALVFAAAMTYNRLDQQLSPLVTNIEADVSLGLFLSNLCTSLFHRLGALPGLFASGRLTLLEKSVDYHHVQTSTRLFGLANKVLTEPACSPHDFSRQQQEQQHLHPSTPAVLCAIFNRTINQWCIDLQTTADAHAGISDFSHDYTVKELYDYYNRAFYWDSETKVLRVLKPAFNWLFGDANHTYTESYQPVGQLPFLCRNNTDNNNEAENTASQSLMELTPNPLCVENDILESISYRSE